MDVSAYLIPNPWPLIVCHKRLQPYGNVSPQNFWKLGGIHIPSATSTLKQIYACALNAVRVCVERCEQQVALKVLILQSWMWMHLNGEGDSMLITCPVNRSIKNWQAWWIRNCDTHQPASVHIYLLWSIHCKYSCDGCRPSRWIKQVSRSGWQLPRATSPRWTWELRGKTWFCSNDVGRGQNRSTSPYYVGKPDSFIDSKIVATKWKQITDWNNRCGCINWLQCFFILLHSKGTVMENSSTFRNSWLRGLSSNLWWHKERTPNVHTEQADVD